MKSFNVIIYDINRKVFEPYDVIPYLVRRYQKERIKLTTVEEFKTFVKEWSQYQWWARCEYEIILSDWPSQEHEEKWDVYQQIMLNLETIAEILMKDVNDC